MAALIKRRRDLLVTVGILLVAFAIYYPNSFAAMQRRNMALAEAHIPVLKQALGTDARFAKVTLSVFTGDNGCLAVGGSVLTDADCDRLREIIAATSPPTAVRYMLLVESRSANTQPTTSQMYLALETNFAASKPATAP